MIAVAEFLDFWASFRDVMRLILVDIFVVVPVLVVIVVVIRITLFEGARSTSFVSGTIRAINLRPLSSWPTSVTLSRLFIGFVFFFFPLGDESMGLPLRPNLLRHLGVSLVIMTFEVGGVWVITVFIRVVVSVVVSAKATLLAAIVFGLCNVSSSIVPMIWLLHRVVAFETTFRVFDSSFIALPLSI